MSEDDKYWSDRGNSIKFSGVRPGEWIVAPTPVPLARIFELITEGANPRTDAIDICEQVLMELQPYERRAVLAYLAATVAVE